MTLNHDGLQCRSVRTKSERERESESKRERAREREREWNGRNAVGERARGGWQKGVEEGEKGVWYAKSISIGTKFAGLEASR